MDRREVPWTPPIFRRAGQGGPASTGPVAPGTPPAEDTPEGTPSSAGPSPTRHPSTPPPAAAEDSEASHPAPAEGGSEVAESASSDTSSAEDEVVAEAEKVLLDDFNKLAAERDDYLDQLRRTRADFDNYRKRMVRQQQEQRERAAESRVEKLLPVLDTFEAAVSHGQGFEQVQASLVSLLEKEGLQRIDPVGKSFDPSEADAVAHEEGDGGQVVAEVLRPGYRWKGRVVRPAMVRVRG
jgi:molecular chaperone GrpE